MSLTAEATVKLYLNKTSLTALETAIVGMLLPMVDGQIESYCGWEMLANDYTAKKYDGNGTAELDLGLLPLNSVTEVLIDDGAGTITEVTTEILLKEEEGIIYLPDTATVTSFTSGTRNVSVTFNAGYSEIPPELSLAATQLVIINFNRITQENIGIVEEQFEQDRVKYDNTDIPKAVQTILNRYRKVYIL